MSQKLKCHEKNYVAPKLKCYQNWNFTLTEMLQNLRIFSKLNLNKKKIQEIGTDHLGLVFRTIKNGHYFSTVGVFDQMKKKTRARPDY